jgi:hypothetical protein
MVVGCSVSTEHIVSSVSSVEYCEFVDRRRSEGLRGHVRECERREGGKGERWVGLGSFGF